MSLKECDGMWNEYECEAQFVMGILNILLELSVIRLYVLPLTIYILVKHISFRNFYVSHPVTLLKERFSKINQQSITLLPL